MNQKSSTNPTLYKILAEYCDDKPYSTRDLEKYLELEQGGLWSRLQMTDIRSLSKTKKVNLKNLAIILHLGFNIPLTIFGINLNEVFTKYSPNSLKISSLADFLHLSATKQKDKEELILSYPNTLSQYISKAKKEIWVYDYFVSEAGSEKYLREAHKKHYEAIEQQLEKHKKIEYHRLLAFPYETIFETKESPNFFELIKMVIEKCSQLTFHHILECFFNFESRFNLSITFIPYRLYSYAIIDSDFLMLEYLKYKDGGLATPDLLFVNAIREDDNMKDVKDVYVEEISNHEEKKSLVTKYDFVSSIKQVIENNDDQIGILQQKKRKNDTEREKLKKLIGKRKDLAIKNKILNSFKNK